VAILSHSLPSWRRLLLELTVAILAAGVVVEGLSLCWPAPRLRLILDGAGGISPDEFTADSQKLLGTSHTWDGRERIVWDVNTGQVLTRIPREAAGDCGFTPDGGLGRQVMDLKAVQRRDDSGLGRHTGMFVRREVTTGQDATTPVKGLNLAAAMAFAPDAGSLMSQDAEGRLKVYELATGNGRVLPTEALRDVWLVGARFSPDGRTLGAGLSDGTLRFWDLAAGAPAKTFRVGPEKGLFRMQLRSDLQRVLTSESVEETAATGTSAVRRQLWSVSGSGATAVVQLQADLGSDVVSAAFTAIGEVVTVARVPRRGRPGPVAEDSDLEVRNVDSGVVVAVIPASGNAALVSPDGRRLAVENKEGRIELWDLPPRKPVSLVVALAITAGLLGQAWAWWLLRGSNRPAQREETGSIVLIEEPAD
jgi:WD40 repeat protein